MNSNDLRRAFTEYFTERGHVAVPSASLIPHDTSVLFTVAGMVPFKPYFLGEEKAPFPRATSIQKCMRAGGKHNDLENVGRTARHLTFFEMLGNFSFGDYFKLDAIPFAWGLVTDVLGLDPERLWVTVHLSDDEAEAIWRDTVGVPAERIQRLDEDNWWQMADTGPCGPCSEIYYDKGAEYGADGGPAFGSDERFLEIWNLVFMQFERHADGTLVPLPKPCIDTGAGLERIVPILQGKSSVYETDLMEPILQRATTITGVALGASPESDVALKIIADHSRSMTFLVSDGVFPTNEGRGYVLRRIIRRAVLRAYMLGSRELVTPRLIESVVDSMGGYYDELISQREYIISVISREEEAFRNRLSFGMLMLEEELSNRTSLSGAVVFKLHDTYGFPVDLTKEIAEERGVTIDIEGFEAEMAIQRANSRAAGLGGTQGRKAEEYFNLVEEFGATSFTGYTSTADEGRILGVVDFGDADHHGQPLVEVFLDRTCFYPEGGGQVGDVGYISTDTARFEVVDTNFAVPGLIRHVAKVISGTVLRGQLAKAEVDSSLRNASKRNHTGTHLLHWSLREVLGGHVKQQGSLVGPDRLRFDFTHWGPVTQGERREVERMINEQIISNYLVRTEEMPKEEALAQGAIAFFGDKYADVVRVVRAGSGSVELCGGTHVHALGSIGPFRILSESSIGSNTRRIEALTGMSALEAIWEDDDALDSLARSLKSTRAEVLERFDLMRERERELVEANRRQRAQIQESIVAQLLGEVESGRIVTRLDDATPEEMRELANRLKSVDGVEIVVIGGVYESSKVGLLAAVRETAGVTASDLIREAATVVGGGVGRQVDFAQTGGRNVGSLDGALAAVRSRLGI